MVDDDHGGVFARGRTEGTWYRDDVRSGWLVLLAGCYSPSITPGAPCGPGDACPRELVCRAGRCEPPSAGGDGGLETAADAPRDAQPDATGADALACPIDFAPLPGSPGCYRVVPTQRIWTEAADDCVAAGGYLAIPDDEVERAALFAAGGVTTWLGLHDRDTEGTFVTVLGAAATYLPWATGEPNNGNDMTPEGQDCVQFFLTDELDDDFCSRLKNYVCEATP